MGYAQDRPSLELVKRLDRGRLYVSGRNISGQPLVAYVVLVRSADGAHSTVAQGVYTGGDAMAPGASEQLGPIPLENNREEDYRVVLDYVRLADGTEAGPKSTEQARQAAARFHK